MISGGCLILGGRRFKFLPHLHLFWWCYFYIFIRFCFNQGAIASDRGHLTSRPLSPGSCVFAAGCLLTDGTSYLRVRLGWMSVPWRVQTIPAKPWCRLCHVLLVPDAKNIHAVVPPITPCGRLDGPGSGLETPVRCHLKPRRGSALSEDRLPTILMVCHINPKPITTQWAKIPILQSSSNWNCVPKLSPRNQKLWRHIHIYIYSVCIYIWCFQICLDSVLILKLLRSYSSYFPKSGWVLIQFLPEKITGIAVGD